MRSRHSLALRGLALWLCALQGPLACVPAPLIAPQSGSVEYRAWGWIAVPGGAVDAVGGNLLLHGVELSLDTPLGTQRIQPTWNSAAGAWQWSQLVRYDGATFVDASGARLDAGAVADGAPIPGSGWTRVGASALSTRGGLAFYFAADGSLAHLRWATLDYPRIVFTPTLVSQCVAATSCSALFELELHASGQPTRVRDARSGRTALFDYDAEGRLVVARSAADVAEGRPGTRYEYAGTQLSAITRSEGERVEYGYLTGARVRRVIQRGEGDPEHVFSYYRSAAGGHRTLHRNPLGGLTNVYFDDQRRVLRVERVDAGEQLLLEWQGLRPTRIVDAGGAVTRMTWVAERVAALETPGGNSIAFSYQPGGISPNEPHRDAIARVEDALGLVEARAYDSAGRPVVLENGAGETQALTWNGANLTGTELAGVLTGFPHFGVHGHWLAAVAGGEVAARRAFDLVGNETVPVERLRPGGTLGIGYDADRRVVSLDVAASDDAGVLVATAEIAVTRRSDGGMTRIARPGGGDLEFEHDALGRPVRLRERSGGVWRETRIEYDALGNVTARELPNGMRQEWQLDVYGRVIRHRALRGGALEGEESFSWQGGRIAARSDSLRGGGEIWVYDAAGRTSSIVFGYGESISYSYDLRDRLVGEVYSVPGAGVIADIGTSHDAAGRRISLRDRLAGETLMTWTYQDGRLVATETGNGLRRSIGFDAQGRASGFETRTAQGALVEASTLEREPQINPPRLELRSTTTTAVAATEERYWLPLGSSLANPAQRVGKRAFGWSDGEGGMRRYAWDELGNRSADSHGDAFGYDAERTRLLSATIAYEGVSLEYAYDEAGFVVSRGGVPLEWTASGRLRRHGSATIEWDMAGAPIAISEGGVTREFRLFGGRVESTLSTLGALDLGEVVLSLGSGARRWRHLDFRGQVSFVSDEHGEVVAHYRYQPFGVDAAFGPEADAGRFENRPAFGPFFLLGERVLDPLVGRFLSPDPVIQLASPYVYAYGDPLRFEDQSGRQPESRPDVGQIAATFRLMAQIALIIGLIAGAAVVVEPPMLLLAAGFLAVSYFLEWFYPSGGPSPSPRPSPGPGPGPGGRPGRGTPQLDLSFDLPATGIGCTPFALTRDRVDLQRLLFLLLLLNALVAFAWRRFQHGKESQCRRLPFERSA